MFYVGFMFYGFMLYVLCVIVKHIQHLFDSQATMLVVEELSKVDPSVAAYVDIHNTLVNNLLMKLGNESQKTKYLPILAQKASGSFALTEPTSGSDAFALKTTAKKDGDHYIINGTKMWISNSDVSEVFLLMANVDPSQVS